LDKIFINISPHIFNVRFCYIRRVIDDVESPFYSNENSKCSKKMMKVKNNSEDGN